MSAGSPSLGDRAFFSWNSRLEPEQLEAGVLALSRNGRMERGSWQPRRGMDSVSGALQVDGDPLFLPFFLIDAVGGETVTVSRVDELVTVTFSAPTFGIGTSPAWLGLSGATGSVDPNGQHLMTVVDPTTLTFEIAGASGSETYGGTIKAANFLDDDAAAEIFAACLFSDPSSDSAEFIVLAATGTAFIVQMSDFSVSTIPYPAGEILSGKVALKQVHDRVFLTRDGGRQTWEWLTPLGRPIEAAEIDTNVLRVTLTAHGHSIGDSVVLSDLGFATTDPNGTRTITGTPDPDTITFPLTGGDETFTVDGARLTGGFTKVPAGDFTQPQVFEATGANVTAASGLVTVTIAGNLTIAAEDKIYIHGSDDPAFEQFIGREVEAVSASTTSVTFYLPVPDAAGIGSAYLSIGKRVSQGGGFSYMPAPPWLVGHQRRILCPYRYSQSGDQDAPVYVDRNIRDEIAISDILEPHVYDLIANQFRITGGKADFLVGIQPFAEDAALIFMRNSVHGVFGLNGSLADCSVRQFTDETGCLARRSIAQHENKVLFLADSGVFAVEFLDAYNLRGVDLPLSDAIQPEIDRINADLAPDSVGVYFNNRYLLAVPLDSAPGAGDATGNNSILVFNFQNKGWESLDTVPDSRWNILDFVISRAGQRNDLYAINTLGGVHKLDAVDRDSDRLALAPGGSIETIATDWEMRTRGYDGGTPERKRFSEFQLIAEAAGQNCDAVFSFTTEEPDSERVIGSISSSSGAPLEAGEGESMRLRIGGYRGHTGALSAAAGHGRPKIKSVAITAQGTNRQTVNQK